MVHPLLDINLVNFEDPFEIGGFVSLLGQIGGNMGMAMKNFKPTRESNELRQIANKMVRKLDELLPKMSPANALLVISAYDMAHRFAYGSPADPKAQNKYILQAFDAMIHGDKDVDEYILYHVIENKILLKDKTYLDKPLQWVTTSQDRWFKNFANGTSQSDISDYDTIQQVSVVLRSNLWFYLGNDEYKFKKELYRNYNQLIDDCDISNPKIYIAIQKFLMSSINFMSEDEYLLYVSHIKSEQSRSSRINRFYKAAAELI